MLEGDAEKQIASKLGLSRHTVRQYAKVLCRALGVSTRAALLAQFVDNPPADEEMKRRGEGEIGGGAAGGAEEDAVGPPHAVSAPRHP